MVASLCAVFCMGMDCMAGTISRGVGLLPRGQPRLCITNPDASSLVLVVADSCRRGDSINGCLPVELHRAVAIQGPGWVASKGCLGRGSRHALVGVCVAARLVHVVVVARSRRIRTVSRIRMMATPHTMALSAMLKLGHTHSFSPIETEQRRKSRTPPITQRS